MMNKFKLPFLLSIVAMLTACSDLAVFNPKGSIAAQEMDLIITATLLMLLIVIPVIFLTFYIVRKYRASNQDAKYDPDWAESHSIEIGMWLIPCIIILILAVITWRTSHTLDPYKPLDSDKKPVKIQAVALDWKWLFIYPEEKIATINYIQVPINTPINFEITSQGPMNSLLIPQLGGQIYAMAGMRTKLHLIGDTEGVYDGFSANYSGGGFSEMRFKAKVSNESEYKQWVSKVQHSSGSLNMAGYQALTEPTEKVPVTYYASVQDGLFQSVINSIKLPSENSQEEGRK